MFSVAISRRSMQEEPPRVAIEVSANPLRIRRRLGNPHKEGPGALNFADAQALHLYLRLRVRLLGSGRVEFRV